MISYTKYNSCGNDFIIVDNEQNIFVKSKLVDFVNDSQSYIKKFVTDIMVLELMVLFCLKIK